MDSASVKKTLELQDAEITYYPTFFSKEQADIYFEVLRGTFPWQQDEITLFGKTYPQPRLTALFGNNGKSYSYSNITMQPHPFTPELLQIKTTIEKEVDAQFTTCLANLYRNGKDSNGWHSDDEKELGQNPIIASVSLGAPRFFHLKHNTNKTLKHKLLLEHGSLLLMQGKTQHFWQHQIPKTAKKIEERINLTFRIIA
ncbi:alpha-ketoglutarate-dependent dioxygenase AlkB [Muricauda sp. JGD-17]|uniref:Alpha-ketoglutarate-dependent dioxygenase AlkB n=1 Tax=Flagellimonas ochracea TaxID=2696472 RepID=A0A964TE50_9FLAO|nr:alpha-ketoglutarate-dependent dioxygenase AlkB [Allomuricauda ochracea]NAY93267.1 alpha-ketoglutarate-dependent dioxygenase AlkB [Allomuricauda ochracea]